MKLIFQKLPSKLVEVLFSFAIVFYILISFSCRKKDVEIVQQENTFGIAKYMYYEDVAMWNHIFNETQPYVIPEDVSPVSVMIPHHDITTQKQNSFYKAVAKEIQPSVIVIVAPDHFECGKNLITMPESTVFTSPEGDLEIDYSLINSISQNEQLKNNISLQDDLWFNEHGIFTHTPFLKHYFPDSKIIPVLVKMLSTEEEFECFNKFGQVLSEVLPEDSFLIASVDCSHYQIPEITELHDDVTYNTIQNLEDPRYAEIDSPESVQVLYSYNKCRNAEIPVLIHHTATFDFIPQEMIESTSHLYWTFYDEKVNPKLNDFYDKVAKTNQRYRKDDKNKKAQTILITGSGKTGAGIRETWIWDRYNTSKNPAEILLKNAAGKEARFFYGFDALIFDPEVNTKYERKIHNTTLIVETINQSDFEKNLLLKKESAEQTIRVLEIVLEADKILPEENKIEQMMKNYDVIVFRDDEGIIDATLFYKDDLGNVQKVNLGICHGKGSIKGSVAILNYQNDKVGLSVFEYQSDDGIIPAIHQFIPEE